MYIVLPLTLVPLCWTTTAGTLRRVYKYVDTVMHEVLPLPIFSFTDDEVLLYAVSYTHLTLPTKIGV